MDRTDEKHLVNLPGTDWGIWRDALLRSAGFPIGGLDRLSAPQLAALADRYLDGEVPEAELESGFDAASAAFSAAIYDVAASERFRMAVMWQNPEVLSSINGVLREGPQAVRNARQRRREDVIAKYWQRYCAKNDTAGFFGPMCWTELTSGDEVSGQPGPGLIRRTAVYFEWWALTGLAERLAEDPQAQRHLPVNLRPQLSVRDRTLASADGPARPLTPAVAALLAQCDGRVTLAELAERLTASGVYRTAADVFAEVRELTLREVLWVGLDLPMDLSAERALTEFADGIPDEEIRARAQGMLSRMTALRDAAAVAATPDELASALSALDTAFEEITGRPPRHRAGQTYAGRTLCHIETSRDLDLTFGPGLLEKLRPLEPLLLSARWLTGAMARVYERILAELHTELVADQGTPEVPLRDLWFLAQGAVFGKERPAAQVVTEFLSRWQRVLRLDEVADGTAEVQFSTSTLLSRVHESFGDEAAPGWWRGRMHSPDLHICAPDWDSVRRGEYHLVLGEIHIGAAALNTDFFRLGHPDPQRLADALIADLPGSRVELLLPDEWPRNCARNADWIKGPDDVQLGFAAAAGADPARLLPVTGLTVAATDTGLVVSADDGRSWPILEIFAELLNIQTFDTWKLAGNQRHTPRVVVDGLVLTRQTWRTTAGETGLATASGERERYLAARRWRRELGLPERIFVLSSTETKPMYIDLTSPLYVRQLCTMMRGAREKAGDNAGLTVTEMLPGEPEAWLTDAQGQRYVSELRLHIRDGEPPAHAGGGKRGR
jgi:hypothetical protein